MANTRIIDQTEITTLSGGEYLVTDSATAGTKKITPANMIEALGVGDTVEIYVQGTSLIINTELVNGNEVSY